MSSSLTREWRPQRFADVLGQPVVVRILTNSIRNKQVSHTYLFCGQYGSGKTTCARLLAKAINCEQLRDNCEPCGKCASCRAVTTDSSPDVIELDAASNNGVDDARALADHAKHRPTMSRRKVYIVDECHAITTQAWNALLKTIEEPPRHLVFIFATTDPERLPKTILSRCQRLDFRRISMNDVRSSLLSISEHYDQPITKDAVDELAKAAQGSLRDAQRLLEQAMRLVEGREIKASLVRRMLGLASPTLIMDLTDALAQRDVAQAHDIVDESFNNGLDPYLLARGLVDHLHSLMLFSLGVMRVPPKGAEDWQFQLDHLSYDEIRKLLGVFMFGWDTARDSLSARTLLDLHVSVGVAQLGQKVVRSSRG